jgi:hypothetical protein
MSNLGRMFQVFLLSSFLFAASTASPTFLNHSEFEHLEHLENLEHLEHLDHIERLENLEHNNTNATNLEEIECESCEFLTHKIDTYIFHNEKVMGFVKNEFDNICSLLPDDAKNICYATVNQTLPSILDSIGDFIATNGCEEIGICHT